MPARPDASRRQFLKRWMLATLAPLTLGQLRLGRAGEAPLLSPDDAAAKTLKYTEDASKAKGIAAGNSCATCALYQGAYGSTQGPCEIFPGKQVKAAGWCSSWAPQM